MKTYIINHNLGNISDPVGKTICKNKFQPNILLVKSSLENQSLFRFKPYQNSTWRKKFKILILTRQLLRIIFHLSCNFSAENLENFFNECLITGNFPDNLKLVDITPVFNEKGPLSKKNCRPVSVLSSISKILKKRM